MVFSQYMADDPRDQKEMRSSVLHFMTFTGGFLIILTVALSLFSYTSASGV
ncbi:MAG: hypothetical protein AB203_04290 [Parcubacteria bacterium C7867-008]|nr:MAG: hypothetical protein AB203_04290 [Parcubacteria bacterium C7867-008]